MRIRLFLAIIGALVTISGTAHASKECFDRVKLVNSQVLGQNGSWSPNSSYVHESDYLIGVDSNVQIQLLSLPDNTKFCVDVIQLQSFPHSTSSDENKSPVYSVRVGTNSAYIEHVYVQRALAVKAILRAE
jgi:hypothetical protein